ncbi:MAG: class I SAM-dependent methyltransferase [bacterium]|nr:class I SAM-dependent methyltransferase [bacterium]
MTTADRPSGPEGGGTPPCAEDRPRLYHDLAPWFHLLTAPADYAEEAAWYWRLLVEACGGTPRTLLELGCGGGCNASHLKANCQLTLSDFSPAMLEVSRGLNPDCEHLPGDMRTLRLGRTFDAVLLHDAASYLTTRADLLAAARTAFAHCRPGGAALFCPDHTRESFTPGTSQGGHDEADGRRGLRYLEWTWDTDSADTSYVCDFALLLREAEGRVRCVHDRHLMGCFPRRVWLETLAEAGFLARALPFVHSEAAPGGEVFLALRPS